MPDQPERTTLGGAGRGIRVRQSRPAPRGLVLGPNARTARWQAAIVNWHRARVTNCSTEAINNLVKRVKHATFGFRRFAHYHIRALLYAGRPNWTLLATVTLR